MFSTEAADDNRMEEARKYAKYSCWTSLTGIGLTVVSVVITMVVVSVKVARTVDETVDTVNRWNG